MSVTRINFKTVLCVAFSIIIIFLPYKYIFSKAEEISAIADIDPTISATLYDTNQYSGGTGVELTEEGGKVKGWQFETSKFLQIDPLVPPDGNTYIVTVKLPQELYIVTSELVAPTGYQSVEFTKNESVVINENTSYDLNTYSGTAEYTMNTMGMSGTIQLEISYDVVLWDKAAASSLTSEGIEPIVVTLSKKDTQGTINEIKKISISEATSGNANIEDVRNYYINIEGSDENIVAERGKEIYKDKKVKINTSVILNDGNIRYKYYPYIEFIINLPYYTDSSGEKHYILISTEEKIINGIKYSSYEIDTSNMLNHGIIVVKIENAYFNAGNILGFWIGPLNDELQEIEQDSFEFTGGSVIGMAEGKNGNKQIQYCNSQIYSITYQTKLMASLVLDGVGRNISIAESPQGTVSHLGGFYFSNEGENASGALKIYNEFDTENTNSVKVTTINTLADNEQEYIDITYTLVDENGNRVYMDSEGNVIKEGTEGAIGEWIYSIKNNYYNSILTNNLNNMLTRNMLPENQRQFYFKTIEYTISKISGLSKLNQHGYYYTSGGNFYGYVGKDAVPGVKAYYTMTVTSVNNDIEPVTKTLYSFFSEVCRPSILIENVEINKSNIQAGESVISNCRLRVHNYPYDNASWLKGITLGVILPKGITINTQSISIFTESEMYIDNFIISNEQLEDGNILWKIKLPEEIYIGYTTEDLKSFELGSFIDFSMQLDTSQTLNNITLFLKNMLIATGDKQENGSNGAFRWALKTDIYDLNENGTTTDYIAGVNATDTTSCQINAQNASLEIEDCITIEKQGSVTNETIEESLLTQEDIINYNFDIKSTSGGTAEGFEYYIPIPKTTSEVDGVYIKGSSEQMYDLAIIESASIAGSDVFNIEYSFETGISYEEAQELTTWYTSEQIESDTSLNWEDVTIVKITNKEGTSIQNGDNTRITIKMKYAGEQYSTEAGMTNTWNSAGYYKYISGDRVNEGHYTTQGVSVDLKYSIELNEITLTAAANMTPQIEGNVNTQTVGSTVLPEFKKNHTFWITSVETYNTVLQTKEYIEQNTGMSITDANKTFAITANMPEGTEQSILSDVSSAPIEIGSISENSVPEFTFKIYNANSLTDNSQTRYIIVTMESDNGVTIKQKININRETTEATDPKSAIVSGKVYVPFDDTTSSVTISQDSAFTAQFVISYIPNNYINPELIFSNNLPIGTNIILENLTDTQNPTYWYYKVNTEIANIKLEDFNSMGKVENENYTTLSCGDIVEEKILVIVDYSQCENGYLAENTYTLKMKLTGNDETIEDFISKELEFITKLKRSFTMGSDAEATVGSDFSVNYSINDTEGSESKYEGRKMSLVLTAPNDIPSDTNLTTGNTTYYLNSNKQFIIPLGDIEAKTENITMKICSNMMPSNVTQYEFDIALWISATANANAPMLGEKVGSSNIVISSQAKISPSLKVTNIQDRIVHKNELSNTNIATYEYLPDTDCTVTVELQQKVGASYQKLTDRLNQVNGTTEHSFGVYSLNANKGNNDISFVLSSFTSSGTYRLVFKVNDSDGIQILQIPYNFIVTQ